MKRRRAYAIIVTVALVLGCSEDSTAPDRSLSIADIEGGWEVTGQCVDGLVHDLPHNYGVWYFSGNGDYCSLWRTAYGTFIEGYTGRVSPIHLVLTVDAYTGEKVRWALSLSANADTLHADLVVPGTSEVDSWILVPEVDAPEPYCLH